MNIFSSSYILDFFILINRFFKHVEISDNEMSRVSDRKCKSHPEYNGVHLNYGTENNGLSSTINVCTHYYILLCKLLWVTIERVP